MTKWRHACSTVVEFTCMFAHLFLLLKSFGCNTRQCAWVYLDITAWRNVCHVACCVSGMLWTVDAEHSVQNPFHGQWVAHHHVGQTAESLERKTEPVPSHLLSLMAMRNTMLLPSSLLSRHMRMRTVPATPILAQSSCPHLACTQCCQRWRVSGT